MAILKSWPCCMHKYPWGQNHALSTIEGITKHSECKRGSDQKAHISPHCENKVKTSDSVFKTALQRLCHSSPNHCPFPPGHTVGLPVPRSLAVRWEQSLSFTRLPSGFHHTETFESLLWGWWGRKIEGPCGPEWLLGAEPTPSPPPSPTLPPIRIKPRFPAFLDGVLLWLYPSPAWEGARWDWSIQKTWSRVCPYTPHLCEKTANQLFYPGDLKQRATKHSVIFFFRLIVLSMQKPWHLKHTYLFFKPVLKQKEILMWSSDLVIKRLRRLIPGGQAYASGYKFSCKWPFPPFAFPDLLNRKIFFCGSVLMGS